jgi:hypothetical protein
MKYILKGKCACGAVDDIREKLANLTSPHSPAAGGPSGGRSAVLRPNDDAAKKRVRQFGRLEYRPRFGRGQKSGRSFPANRTGRSLQNVRPDRPCVAGAGQAADIAWRERDYWSGDKARAAGGRQPEMFAVRYVAAGPARLAKLANLVDFAKPE